MAVGHPCDRAKAFKPGQHCKDVAVAAAVGGLPSTTAPVRFAAEPENSVQKELRLVGKMAVIVAEVASSAN